MAYHKILKKISILVEVFYLNLFLIFFKKISFSIFVLGIVCFLVLNRQLAFSQSLEPDSHKGFSKSEIVQTKNENKKSAESIKKIKSKTHTKTKIEPLIVKAAPVRGELLFEGYSKVISGGQHIGYTVSRYEYDAKKAKFYGGYFTLISTGTGEIRESLTAEADESLRPLTYSYTSRISNPGTAGEIKQIDARFANGKLIADVLEKGKKKKVITDIPKGAILSSFLVYLILKSETGMQSKTRYSYSALAEEDAKLYPGTAEVGSEEVINGIRAFKIKNEFKDLKFDSYVNDRGHVIVTETMGLNIRAELMDSPDKATGKFKVPNETLKVLFGGIPLGITNAITEKIKGQTINPNATPGTKQQGLPPDSNILMKSAPDEKQSEDSLNATGEVEK